MFFSYIKEIIVFVLLLVVLLGFCVILGCF